jgi:uncharacterized protein (DUF58 family)
MPPIEFRPLRKAGGTPPPLPKKISSDPVGLSPLLSIEELERFKNLLLFAQATVDGFFTGKHRSSHAGGSAEFRDYKSYVRGDPVEHIDWRAYGRTRRLFIRRHEDETDMVAYLLVDASGSMRYAGARRFSKFQHAARVAAALAYLMLKQGDKTALGLFGEKLKSYIPPGGTRRHLREILSTLESARPSAKTGLAAALREAASVFRKRGRLILLSDFLVKDQAEIFDALSEFKHRNFGILLLQVFDPDELDLPAHSVAKYVDMETAEEIEVDAEELRADYRKQVRDAIDALAREADARQIEYKLVNTGEPYTAAIEAYIGFRGHSKNRR